MVVVDAVDVVVCGGVLVPVQVVVLFRGITGMARPASVCTSDSVLETEVSRSPAAVDGFPII